MYIDIPQYSLILILCINLNKLFHFSCLYSDFSNIHKDTFAKKIILRGEERVIYNKGYGWKKYKIKAKF